MRPLAPEPTPCPLQADVIALPVGGTEHRDRLAIAYALYNFRVKVADISRADLAQLLGVRFQDQVKEGVLEPITAELVARWEAGEAVVPARIVNAVAEICTGHSIAELANTLIACETGRLKRLYRNLQNRSWLEAQLRKVSNQGRVGAVAIGLGAAAALILLATSNPNVLKAATQGSLAPLLPTPTPTHNAQAAVGGFGEGRVVAPPTPTPTPQHTPPAVLGNVTATPPPATPAPVASSAPTTTTSTQAPAPAPTPTPSPTPTYDTNRQVPSQWQSDLNP